MPTYQYSCSKCGDDFEVYQSFSDSTLKRHQGCGGSVQKVFAPVGIVLKGSGFYKTDNRSGSRSGTSEKSESSGGETKSGTKSESKADKSSGANGSSGNGSKKDSGKGSGTTKPAKQSA